MIERKAVPEAGVELNESLLNRRLVILYRHTEWGCRWRSQCMVQAVLQRHRSAAGQVETLELKREDDTLSGWAAHGRLLVARQGNGRSHFVMVSCALNLELNTVSI